MAVNIPQIQRGKGVSQDSIGRVQVDTSSGTEAYMKNIGTVAKTVSNVADTYVDQQIKAQEQVRKTTADKLAVEYDSNIEKHRKDFEVLPLGDDLNGVYNDKVKQRDDTKIKFLTLQNLDESTKKLLETEMTKRDALWDERMYTKLAQSNVAYQAKTAEGKVKMFQKDAVTYGATVNPKDPASFGRIDEALSEIEKTVKNSAQALGVTQTDKSGQPVYSDVTNNALAKVKSDTIQATIDGLLGINQVDKAKAVYDRYSPELELLTKPEVTNKLNKAVANNEVIKEADKIIRTVPREQQFDAVLKIQDSEKARLVGDRVNSHRIKEDKKIKDIRDKSYSGAHDIVYNIMQTPERFNSVDQMRNHPKVAPIWNNLDSTQKNSLESLIKRPDTSNYEQLDKVSQMNESGKLRDVPDRKTFDSLTNQMSTKDYGKYLKQWEDAKDPKAKGLSSGTRSNILAKSKELFKSSGLLNTVRGTNKIDPKSLKKWEAFQDELFADFDGMDGTQYQPNSKQTQEYVKSKVNEYILKNKKEDKGFFGGLFDKAKSAIQNNKKEAPKSKDQLIQDL